MIKFSRGSGRAARRIASPAAPTTARKGRTATVARPGHAGVPLTRSASGRINGSTTVETSDVPGGGTATLGRQHLHDERAEQREVVRRLCPMGGEHARPPAVLSRALLPRDPLLTLHGGLVWQENGPQLRAAADPHQAAHRRRAGGRSSSTTRRRRGKCSQPPPPPIAGARPALCELARIAPIGAVGWIFARVSRA